MIPACREIRKEILRISELSGHGHIPTCFSVVEILYALYSVMRHDPRSPSWKERDVFILSKGHASLGLYCTLAEFGYFDKRLIDTFGSFMSSFGGHADRFKIPGVEASTGSLGHGIGLAVGMALGMRIDKADRRVYTLVGDGEANEGSVWEATMVAANLKLSNLVIFYDNNRSHARGLQLNNPLERFRSFGCDAVEVAGHDVDALKEELLKKSDTVKVIVANTTKGYGCRTLIGNQYEWHRKSPDKKEFACLMEELDEKTV